MKLEVSEYPIPQIIVLLAEVRYHFVSYQVAISRKRKAKGIVMSSASPGLEMPAAYLNIHLTKKKIKEMPKLE